MFDNWAEVWDCYKFIMQGFAMVVFSLFTLVLIFISVCWFIKFIGG